MTTQFPLTGPLSVGDLLDRAFRLYRARFGVFLLTAAIFLVPSGIIFSLDTPDSFGANDLLIILAFMLANGSIMLILTAQSIEALHGRTLSIGEGIRQGLLRIGAYVGMTITAWAAMIAVTTVIAFVSVLYAIPLLFGMLPILPSPFRATDPVVAFGLGALYICVLILSLILIFSPAIYLYSRWLVAPAVLIAEYSGPLDSLRRSWELSHGHGMRVTGYTALLLILMALVNILPLVLLQAYVFELLPNSASELVAGILNWASILLWVVSTPFYIGAVALLYYDLRIRGESYDLELRVAELEEQVAQGAG